MTSTHDESRREKSAIGLTCNIDRRGVRARAIAGGAMVALSLGAGAAAIFADPGALRTGAIIASVSLLLGGGFCLFEAANGWCAVRALGFRTKL